MKSLYSPHFEESEEYFHPHHKLVRGNVVTTVADPPTIFGFFVGGLFVYIEDPSVTSFLGLLHALV
jgi:hypothetical protein